MSSSRARRSLERRISTAEDKLEGLREKLHGEVVREAREDLPLPGPERAKSVPVGTLRAAVRWLTESEQAEDAWVSQFGISRRVGAYRVFLAPDGVLCFTLHEDVLRRPRGGTAINPLCESEVEELARRVQMTSGIADVWNGATFHSVSFRLSAEPSAGIKRAYGNYAGLGKQSGKRVTAPKGWG